MNNPRGFITNARPNHKVPPLKVGGRVELWGGECQGTIVEVMGEYCIKIQWDDGQTGHVHPLDVKHI